MAIFAKLRMSPDLVTFELVLDVENNLNAGNPVMLRRVRLQCCCTALVFCVILLVICSLGNTFIDFTERSLLFY